MSINKGTNLKKLENIGIVPRFSVNEMRYNILKQMKIGYW